MFNVTVLKIKDVVKYLIELIIFILIIICLYKGISGIKIENNQISKKIIKGNLLECIDTELPVVAEVCKEGEEGKTGIKEEFNLYEDILKRQIVAIESFEEKDINEIQGENEEQTNNNQETAKIEEQNTSQEIAKAGEKTEVITNNPIVLKSNVQYQNVKIKNETSYELTEEMLEPNIEINNKNILLFHTHTCESYTASEKNPYTPTGNYRTTDLNFTVAKVGDELENSLKQYGINVTHDKTYHDYPAYNGSYTHSLGTVQEILKTNPSDIIFDIHRDAIGSRSDYAPIVKIGENDIAAQIMFVVGTNEGGLWHPNWNQNLKFAIKVQQKAEEMYPGLFKPIMVTKYRYNQHAGKYASIIEVGATGNTLEQCQTSMKYFAKVLDEVLK